jgi:hypothetical protein
VCHWVAPGRLTDGDGPRLRRLTDWNGPRVLRCVRGYSGGSGLHGCYCRRDAPCAGRAHRDVVVLSTRGPEFNRASGIIPFACDASVLHRRGCAFPASRWALPSAPTTCVFPYIACDGTSNNSCLPSPAKSAKSCSDMSLLALTVAGAQVLSKEGVDDQSGFEGARRPLASRQLKGKRKCEI